MAERIDDLHPDVREAFHPGKAILVVHATDATLAVSDRRMIVHTGDRMALNIPVEGVRRIQYDLEVGRPSTFVIVPDESRHEVQVLGIPYEETRAATDVLVLLSDHFARMS